MTATIVSQTVRYESETLDRIETEWSNGNKNSRYVYREPPVESDTFNYDAVLGRYILTGIFFPPLFVAALAREVFDMLTKKKV